MIDGYRIYYNYLRPSMTLNEKTPSKGEEKWINVILLTNKHKARKRRLVGPLLLKKISLKTFRKIGLCSFGF